MSSTSSITTQYSDATSSHLNRIRDLSEIEQKLLIKYTSPTCLDSKPSISKESVNRKLSYLNTYKTKQLIKDSFNDSNVLKTVLCIADSILLDNNSGMEASHKIISEYITNLNQLPASILGSMSNVMTADLGKDGKDFFIVKSSYGIDDMNIVYTLIHEAAIAILAINQFRIYNIPNFAIIYGIFYCSPSSSIDDNKDHNPAIQLTNCGNTGKIPYVLYETIPGKRMKDFLYDCTSTEFISSFLQLLHAYEFAYNYCGFIHNDLRADNIIMRPVENKSGCWIKYPTPLNKPEHKDRWIFSSNGKIPTIIDYGISQIQLMEEGKIIKLSIVDKNTLTPFNDILLILRESFNELIYKTPNIKCATEILPLIKFFYPEVTINNFKKINRKMISYIDNKNTTINQYIEYIVKIMQLDSKIITEIQPDGYILNSNDTGSTVNSILKEVGIFP